VELYDLFRKSFIEGYASTNLTIGTMVICILCATVLSTYVFIVYTRINKNSFYNKNFNLSLIVMSIITAAIILTIQSNIVISLGMVGALSIIRFRTAIKDPLDLVFLFWSISIGIICGAGLTMIAVLMSIAVTILVLVFHHLRQAKNSSLLVVNADSFDAEDEIMDIIGKYSDYMRVRAKNITKSNLNMAIEIRAKEDKVMMKELMNMKEISSASLVEHEGDVTV